MNARATPGASRDRVEHRGRVLAQRRAVVAEDLDHDLAVDLRDALEDVVADRLREAGLDARESRRARGPSRAISCSLVMWRVHSDSGFTSTKNSAMLISLGSVPSSGRPAFEITVRTSGNWRSSARMRAHSRDASLTEMPSGSITFTQIAPSFSSGRNSLPSCVRSAEAQRERPRRRRRSPRAAAPAPHSAPAR